MCLPGYVQAGVWVGIDENGFQEATVKRLVMIIEQQCVLIYITSMSKAKIPSLKGNYFN